ncbi:hypothetical protein B0T25DRAFT_571028 [Lasiosphaeria hispida]|uniref:Uncharacterized protein n=1 Tax=Lasiosphaeria hispida TaxID=260671 RepID=A0AAJ0HA74_9PEZI|nr:hypothetical protein B0T25DRAFT_571028 [Lasiosphaeria hispida]
MRYGSAIKSLYLEGLIFQIERQQKRVLSIWFPGLQSDFLPRHKAFYAVLPAVILIILLFLCINIKWCFRLTSSKSATDEEDSKHRDRDQNGDADYVHLEHFAAPRM